MSGFNHYRRREARAVNSSNLTWSDLGHTDIDIVVARALSGDKLGALLESLKWAGDHRAYAGAIELLGERFYKRTRRRPLKALLHTAVHEWVNENCRECGGRAIALNRRTCNVCNGTGLHSYDGRERARMASIKAGAWEKHERDYLAVMDCLRDSVTAHRVGAMKALG